MTDILTQSEVDKLLKEIELSIQLPSIIDITPAEIANIRDNATRKNMERKFYLVNELFVMPLNNLLNEHMKSVNPKSGYFYDFSSYSLKQRIHMISKYLLLYGYAPSYLNDILPHTVEEVDKKVKEFEENNQIIQVIDSKSTMKENRKIA